MEEDNRNDKGRNAPPWENSNLSSIRRRAARDDGRSNFRSRVESEQRTGRRSRPRASLAARTVAMRSRGSVRGTIVSPFDDREIHYESILERDAACILLADPRVSLLREQVGPVAFIAADGSEGEHYFDFVATLRDETKLAIAVKYERQVEGSGIRDVLARIDPKATANARVVLRTERQITRVRADNARLVLHANRVADLGEMTALRRFLATVRGVATLEDILRAAGLSSPEGFYAAVRLFGLGFIKCVDGGAFTHSARVRVTCPGLSE